MELRLIVPGAVTLHEEVVRIAAEGAHGCFTLLPEHVDCVTSLVPGIVSCTGPTGRETYLAVDEGLLVKRSERVTISVRQAIRGDSLESLQDAVAGQILRLDSRERQARDVLARLETSLVRGLLDVGGGG